MPVKQVSFLSRIDFFQKENFSERSGFTLAEVLIGVLIIATALAMTTNLLIASNQTNQRARDISSAVLVGRTQLERLRAVPSTAFPQSGSMTQGKMNFKWTAQVEEKTEGVDLLRVVVQWTSREGDNQKEFNLLRSR